jgi:hypothetical protein
MDVCRGVEIRAQNRSWRFFLLPNFTSFVLLQYTRYSYSDHTWRCVSLLCVDSMYQLYERSRKFAQYRGIHYPNSQGDGHVVLQPCHVGCAKTTPTVLSPSAPRHTPIHCASFAPISCTITRLLRELAPEKTSADETNQPQILMHGRTICHGSSWKEHGCMFVLVAFCVWARSTLVGIAVRRQHQVRLNRARAHGSTEYAPPCAATNYSTMNEPLLPSHACSGRRYRLELIKWRASAVRRCVARSPCTLCTRCIRPQLAVIAKCAESTCMRCNEHTFGPSPNTTDHKMWRVIGTTLCSFSLNLCSNVHAMVS